MGMGETFALTELQYNLKRDPLTYKSDFERYYENYRALEQSFMCAPSQNIEKLKDLILFLSQVVYTVYDNRLGCTLLPRLCGEFFLQRIASSFITILRNAHRDAPRNNAFIIQTYLARMIKDSNPTVGREAVFILLRLFKKNVWNDTRTANLIAEACLAKRKKVSLMFSGNSSQVYVPAVRFLLGQEKTPDEKDSDSDSDAEVVSTQLSLIARSSIFTVWFFISGNLSSTINKEARIKQLRLGHRVGCKTKRRQKRLERSIDHVHKFEERKAAKGSNLNSLVAINLLHDPQTFAEKLFRKVERCSDRFEIRLFLLDLITRLIGLHKLLVLNFYPFIQRFLRPHQRGMFTLPYPAFTLEVTRLLLFITQATHDEVPPDVIEPVLRTIADNFITERASSEAITVGLNTTREICARCPYAISVDLLSDLIQYRTYRNKNVVAAARSLIRLYRLINPAALPRKERGRPTEAQLETLANLGSSDGTGLALTFGQSTTAQFVPGAEALVLAESLQKENLISKTVKHTTIADETNRLRLDNAAEQIKDNDEDLESWQSCSTDQASEDEEKENDGGDISEEKEMAVIDGASTIPSTTVLKSVRNDDGWIDVFHSSEEEEDTLTKLPVVSPADLTSKAVELASSRVFTQEEFEAMRKYQQRKQRRFAALGSRNKRKADESESFFEVDTENEEEEENGEGNANGQLVSMSAITRLVKRPRQTKAERLEAVQEGRVGREKYGYKVNRMNPHASTTNREKAKGKTFQMIKHKVRQKAKRSFRDKQIALRDQLRHMIKHMR
ncbi:protein SDA1 [Paragonimus westermani]|uniref:Protein SDA1 n=1 Tax=Paragonimus westermani TaxID=34504 RepID=A0A5J4NYC5_9TREM|nr:protein SDA1 [Paragonimus westermani]